MTSRLPIESLQSSLTYCFVNVGLLEEALTHTSYVNEVKKSESSHNERLEFLGDAVLSLVISEYLAVRLPHCSEGMLSKFKARLVSESSLAHAARRLNLGAYLKLGKGEDRSNGREKDSLLADALEAVLAAAHLDGGFQAGRMVTLRVFADQLHSITDQNAGQPGADDSKTRLQEWCQKRLDVLPVYALIRETGPDHSKWFEVTVSVNGEIIGAGAGRSKKEAEQAAAREGLQRTSDLA
ncbi:Ribonuclease 3 [Nitrospira sp. KM1]|uniref:ribonuclease III n=1 Tax=Nitrospira sp. KM1 TaxID=1936990 RepID=UPI0013A76AF3|nr:ribonuclease III [Nitrospira sp. KM1]BCA55868.1 Ribonuclease 3 [Nitrospira sp. KM1]